MKQGKPFSGGRFAQWVIYDLLGSAIFAPSPGRQRGRSRNFDRRSQGGEAGRSLSRSYDLSIACDFPSTLDRPPGRKFGVLSPPTSANQRKHKVTSSQKVKYQN